MNLKRIVVTGLGIVSSIGNNRDEVAAALKAGRSGIQFEPEYEKYGMRSRVAGLVNIDVSEHIDRKLLRFMGNAAAFSMIAAQQAIAQADIDEALLKSERTSLICGSGGGSTENMVVSSDTLRERGIRRVGPYMVTRTMGSTVSACLATSLGVRGASYSISSACSTSAHCIGHGAEQIQLGKADVVIAGGGEEVHWSMSHMFDAMGAMSSKYNDDPERASRAYDRDRDGFVIAGGGGILVLESLEHAQARGATVLAELTGYGATSDGADMVAPSGEGAERCMKIARSTARQPIDYINAHGTSTPVGDIVELKAMRSVFGDAIPAISSTKSLTGHALGAAGVNEAIYSLIMMQDDFLAASANVENLDPEAEGYPIVREKRSAQLNAVMSNSFGFGGTNASLVFERFNG
ncbi:beta-ketoacyl-ACP synthase I [Gammaproteobacteria bacterium]|nr:beta-ketoacyl-ACP synthase I [Gammaproteobacteria bacterium]